LNLNLSFYLIADKGRSIIYQFKRAFLLWGTVSWNCIFLYWKCM